MTKEPINEFDRLAQGCDLLQHLRLLFAEMENDKERKRAWTYLRMRYEEFGATEMPWFEEE